MTNSAAIAFEMLDVSSSSSSSEAAAIEFHAWRRASDLRSGRGDGQGFDAGFFGASNADTAGGKVFGGEDGMWVQQNDFTGGAVRSGARCEITGDKEVSLFASPSISSFAGFASSCHE